MRETYVTDSVVGSLLGLSAALFSQDPGLVYNIFDNIIYIYTCCIIPSLINYVFCCYVRVFE